MNLPAILAKMLELQVRLAHALAYYHQLHDMNELRRLEEEARLTQAHFQRLIDEFQIQVKQRPCAKKSKTVSRPHCDTCAKSRKR